MNTSTTCKAPTYDEIVGAFKKIKLITDFTRLMELATKEGVLYVAQDVPGALKEAGIDLPPGIKIEECKYMDAGTMAAMDTSQLKKFMSADFPMYLER